MKANELRIGNFVEKSLKSGQGRKIIDRIGCQDIVRIFNGAGSINYSPVPLIDEWKIKLGLEEGHPGYYFKGEIMISTDNQIYFGEEEVWIAEKHLVHELQNLFFALTGEELLGS